MIANVKLIELPEHSDERGGLIALEGMSDIVPFDIKRVYYSFDTQPGNVRGNHAHRCLKQLVVCLSGGCTFVCEMPDGTRAEYVMDWPNKGLLVEGMVWREIKNFTKDCVMIVLASEHYNEADYIRDYNMFLKEVGRT